MLSQLMGLRFMSLPLQTTQPDPGALTPDQITQISMEALRHPGNAATSIVGLLVPIAFFASIVVILWLLLRQKQARIQARTEFHKHLLDKFQSGREFAEFLEGKGSQRFLDELWSQGAGPQNQLLTAMRKGIVLAVLGLGILGMSFTRRGLVIPAVVILALGVGFLISTAISYRLSNQWERNQKLERENQSAS
jgi:hypothetical protein